MHSSASGKGIENCHWTCCDLIQKITTLPLKPSSLPQKKLHLRREGKKIGSMWTWTKNRAQLQWSTVSVFAQASGQIKGACVFPNLCLYKLKVQGWAHLWTGHKNWHSQWRLNKIALLGDNKQLFVITGFVVIRAGQVGENNVTKDKHIWDQTSGTCAHLIWALVQTLSEWCWSQRREGPPEEVTVAEVRTMHCWRCETCFVMTGCLGFFYVWSVNCWTNLAVVIPTGVLPRTLTLVLSEKGGTVLGFISPQDVWSLSNETMTRKKNAQNVFSNTIHTYIQISVSVSVCR